MAVLEANRVADSGGATLTVPPGTLIFHCANSAPSGFLKANGAAVSRTTYAALFAAVGTTFGAGDGSTTFGLPDLRGEFPRGWDDARGIDSGRAFGTAQLDQMQLITGNTTSTYNSNDVFTGTRVTGAITEGPNHGQAVTTGVNNRAHQISFNSGNSPNARVSSTTDGETRPRNIALLACIKF